MSAIRRDLKWSSPIPSRRYARLSPRPVLMSMALCRLPRRRGRRWSQHLDTTTRSAFVGAGWIFFRRGGWRLRGDIDAQSRLCFGGRGRIGGAIHRRRRIVAARTPGLLGFSEERTDFFVENVDWIAGLFDGEPFVLLDDADGDGSPNFYDYTPLPGIDLTLRLSVFLSGRENVGDTANAPFPIFNIWQLQAIGGTVQGIDPENREMVLQAFFEGSNLSNLSNLGGRHYRLSVDIDASPTRDWNDGKGFAPIRSPNDNFSGGLDGGDKWFAICISTARTKARSACSAPCRIPVVLPTSACKTRSSSGASSGSDCGADTKWLPH